MLQGISDHQKRQGLEPLKLNDPVHENLLAAALAVVAILILIFLAFSAAAGVR